MNMDGVFFMQKKSRVVAALMIILGMCVIVQACVTVTDGKKPKAEKIIKVPSGANIPSLGMALDASYDPATNGIVAGYKIISVAITNNSIDILSVDKDTDEWDVIDIMGRKHRAILDLRREAPSVYIALPERLKMLLSYPLIIQVGETRVIDLLFKDNIDLQSFRAVRFESKLNGKTIQIEAVD